jgi:hypothetical protein
MPSTALQARRQRIRHIRRRMIAAGTAVFIATTGGILVQLTSGHDPALARSSASTTKQVSASSSSVATGTPSSSSPSSAPSASTGSASAVTTSQS